MSVEIPSFDFLGLTFAYADSVIFCVEGSRARLVGDLQSTIIAYRFHEGRLFFFTVTGHKYELTFDPAVGAKTIEILIRSYAAGGL